MTFSKQRSHFLQIHVVCSEPLKYPLADPGEAQEAWTPSPVLSSLPPPNETCIRWRCFRANCDLAPGEFNNGGIVDVGNVKM